MDANSFPHAHQQGGDYSNGPPYQHRNQPYRRTAQYQRFYDEPEQSQRWLDGTGMSAPHDWSGNFGIGVAVVAIFLFQFRGAIVASLKETRRNLSDNGLLFFVLYAFDHIWHGILVVVEAVLNLRFLVSPPTGVVGENEAVARSRRLVKMGPGTNDGSRRRRKIYDRGESGSSMMPELEEVKTSNDSEYPPSVQCEASPKADRSSCSQQEPSIHWNDDEIEPAFLNDEDYPAGWLVYHPIHGVISKEDADRYKEDLRRKEEMVCMPVSALGNERKQ